jgi:hypothetical protein
MAVFSGVHNNNFSQCTPLFVIDNDPNLDISLLTLDGNNGVVFDYAGCNICQYYDPATGFSSAATKSEICQCREDCKYDLEEYENCMETCYETHGQYEYNYTLLHQCYDYCEQQEDIRLNDCLENCGEEPESLHTVLNWGLYTEVWWTTELVETGLGFYDEYHITYSTPTTLNPPPKKIYQPSWVDLPDHVSYCIYYEFTIRYTDGLCCILRGYKCVQLG